MSPWEGCSSRGGVSVLGRSWACLVGGNTASGPGRAGSCWGKASGAWGVRGSDLPRARSSPWLLLAPSSVPSRLLLLARAGKRLQ